MTNRQRKLRDIAVFIAIVAFVTAISIILSSCCERGFVANVPLEYDCIQDVLYSPDDNMYYIEYENIFKSGKNKKLCAVKKDYLIIEMSKNVFFKLVGDMKAGLNEEKYYIRIYYVKETEDYYFNLERR